MINNYNPIIIIVHPKILECFPHFGHLPPQFAGRVSTKALPGYARRWQQLPPRGTPGGWAPMIKKVELPKENMQKIWKHDGKVWKIMETSGKIWENYGNILEHMEKMETYGNIWENMEK